ncbi:hypothetical protein [Phthorimaea operculella granulovirus]|uniref:Pif-6 n=1 Tax=Phthorimaea operculella granulovirus TaxID=192584 RepID=Q8JRV3_9BBAC|nr:hypothetical protein [Phthorimaea operculella granulovirus]AAM70304.1 hypothetical protein [Phthorimaea operculella granulovirus]ANY57495.1 hypothetical protein PhopGVgp106 [Phthorimaea operculella granulovirus]QBH65941.1 hypothetical protein PhopGVgp106 [Phthorimaea operculella granulovirus]QBH66071.1 hypothetical protein PhopGVgp106 [Phthorimaea operculella granulovirus]QBH66201.1 hypothetical protein PhopGVgp106 [Phthorimaea operculella granulovirus]
MSSEDADLLVAILKKYNWQIVDRRYIEVIASEREHAWKDLILMILRTTPKSYRKNLRSATLEHFDYKQPIMYDLKQKKLSITSQSVIDALNVPRKPMKMITPVSIFSGFILLILSYLTVEGVTGI